MSDYSKGGQCPFAECLVDAKDIEIAALKTQLVEAKGLLSEYLAVYDDYTMQKMEAKALIFLNREDVKAILAEKEVE